MCFVYPMLCIFLELERQCEEPCEQQQQQQQQQLQLRICSDLHAFRVPPFVANKRSRPYRQIGHVLNTTAEKDAPPISELETTKDGEAIVLPYTVPDDVSHRAAACACGEGFSVASSCFSPRACWELGVQATSPCCTSCTFFNQQEGWPKRLNGFVPRIRIRNFDPTTDVTRDTFLTSPTIVTP